MHLFQWLNVKRILETSLLLALFVLGFSCDKSSGVIMTVTGPIPASEIGPTLQHEHILVDFIGADSTGYHRWDKQEVVDRALPFLEELKALGCQTFFDCTPAYVGRDPEILRQLAQKTGLQIVTNTGFYGARNNIYLPSRAFTATAERLAEEWIAEAQNGIEGSGIRPGFIKISVDANDSLSEIHAKLIRAAALTHRETGLAIMSHTGPDEPAFDQLAVLEEMEVPADAFIWTHAQGGTPEGWIKAAKMGAWVSLDNVNVDNLETYVKNLQRLKSAGVWHRILISHDSGWYSAGEENGGGYNGYTVIFKGLLPLLREHGFSQKEIRQLMVENPAQAFGIRRI